MDDILINLTRRQKAQIKAFLKEDSKSLIDIFKIYGFDHNIVVVSKILDLINKEYGKRPDSATEDGIKDIINKERQKFATDGFVAGVSYMLDILGITVANVEDLILHYPGEEEDGIVYNLDSTPTISEIFDISEDSFSNTPDSYYKVLKHYSPSQLKAQLRYMFQDSYVKANDTVVIISQWEKDGEENAWSLLIPPSERYHYFNTIDELFDAELIDGRSLNSFAVLSWENRS